MQSRPEPLVERYGFWLLCFGAGGFSWLEIAAECSIFYIIPMLLWCLGCYVGMYYTY